MSESSRSTAAATIAWACRQPPAEQHSELFRLGAQPETEVDKAG
ncbi:MAG TPA: hypothetical protein VN688_14180 [Gemmataceae bacterium]|nr:hypothetical protein [Gemmataceae bacterium]